VSHVELLILLLIVIFAAVALYVTGDIQIRRKRLRRWRKE